MGLRFSRQTGGIGTRGPGEKKLEIDRRRIRRRIHELEAQIALVKEQRHLRRGKREKTGVPTVAVVGYTNASWTLKADLVSEYVVRLLSELDARGASRVEPIRDDQVTAAPLMPLDAGYIQRAAGQLPQAGDRQPWQMPNNYLLDIPRLRRGRIDDGVLEFG